MKLLLSIIALFILSCYTPLVASSIELYKPLPDSIPPPPPDTPVLLYGPSEPCLGDTAVYTTDVPLGCSTQWYVDNVIQGSTSASIEVNWTSIGSHTISTYFDCGSGAEFAETFILTVYTIPIKPGPINGDTAICEFTNHTYSTTVGPNESCEWYVAGELQASADTFMVYSFGASGDYFIEVRATSDCGTSIQSEYLLVKAAGLAPDPPGPIEGPEESCVGDTETYTTTIDPDVDCQWRVNNVLQETTLPVLEVDWSIAGTHEVEVRSLTDCGSSNPITLQVMVYDIPQVNLGNDTTIFDWQTIILDAENTGSQYLWSTGDTTQTILVSESGDYSVLVSNFCGEDSDSIFVDVFVGVEQIKEEYTLIVSNKQKMLTIETPGQEIMQIQIADISGQQIYNGKGIKQISLPKKGIYILVIKTNKTVFNRKVLVF